jgi:tripartite-type tricarboxylate transporter receptor subunit TctC
MTKSIRGSSRRHFNLGLIAASTGALFSVKAAWGQAKFPDRTIKLIVPYAAGGGTDTIARLVAQGVGDALGQTMIVENNGTAGGNVATQSAATAPKDGYTVLMANQGPMVVNPHLFASMKVDPLTAFDPITLIASAPLVMVLPKESPFKDFPEFLDFARKNPDKLTYGSAGNGSASHLATLLLAHLAKFKAVHVPYRGAAPAITDLMGGRTDFMITTLPSVLGQIEGNTVKTFGITSKERASKFANIPTIAEQGVPGYEASAWYGFVVPTGTPKDIIEILRQATLKAIQSPILGERLGKEGASLVGNSPETFGAMMKAESARWAEVIKAAGLSLN